MALELLVTAVKFLKDNPENRYTARDIATWIYENKAEDCQEKIKNTKITNETELLNQLVAELSRSKFQFSKHGIDMTAERPRKYYYSPEKNYTDSQNDDDKDEHSMYPKLIEYLRDELGVYSRRINEKTSSNSQGGNGNVWLHPDVAGFRDISENWITEIKDCIKEHSYDTSVLWSFEVKINIKMSSLRKDFFQVVSNSSWANYSYLVTSEINDNAIDELRLLSQSYNIGIIRLDMDNPSDSEIVIPCIKKEKLDWNMMNRICKENSDFKEYINRIKIIHKSGEFDKSKWGWKNNK